MRTISTIGERIKAVRNAAGLTQQEFADRLGISRSNIGNYESGSRYPIDAAVKLICEKFHVNEAWLRSGVDEMQSRMDIHEELTLRFAEVLRTCPDKRSALIAAILAQPPEFFDLIADMAEDIVARINEKEG